MLEINANPDRRDLSDIHARLAAEAGVPIMINSDAHSAGTLAVIRYGVATARRAWLTAEQVANTRPLARAGEAPPERRRCGQGCLTGGTAAVARDAPSARACAPARSPGRERSAPRSSARRRAPRSPSRPPPACATPAPRGSRRRRRPPELGYSHEMPAATSARQQQRPEPVEQHGARPDLAAARGRAAPARAGARCWRVVDCRRPSHAPSAAATAHHARLKIERGRVVPAGGDRDRHDRPARFASPAVSSTVALRKSV